MGGGDLWNLDTSINLSSKKKTEKEVPQGNILDFFLPDTPKMEIENCMKNLIQLWTQSGPFFQKSGLFFRFSKVQGKTQRRIYDCCNIQDGALCDNS